MTLKKYSYFTDPAKKPFLPFMVSASLALAMIASLILCNLGMSYYFIENYPKLISKVVASYFRDPQSFGSVFYLTHVYFSFLLNIGLPIVAGISLLLSIFYFKKKKFNLAWLMLFIPLLFVITTYALAEMGLSFV